MADRLQVVSAVCGVGAPKGQLALLQLTRSSLAIRLYFGKRCDQAAVAPLDPLVKLSTMLKGARLLFRDVRPVLDEEKPSRPWRL
jgi:hypothetical protein